MLKLQCQVIARLRRRPRRLRQAHLKAGIHAANVCDIPGHAAYAGHAHLSLGTSAEIDVAEIHERRLEGHIAADVARHPNLHLREKRFVEGHGQRRAVLAQKRSCVELRDDLRRLVRLEIVLRHFGRGAAAAGPHTHDVQIFLVDVAEDEAILRLRTLGNGAEVVARHRKHFLGPLLGRCWLRGAEQRDGHAARDRAGDTDWRANHGRTHEKGGGSRKRGPLRPRTEYECHGMSVNARGWEEPAGRVRPTGVWPELSLHYSPGRVSIRPAVTVFQGK